MSMCYFFAFVLVLYLVHVLVLVEVQFLGETYNIMSSSRWQWLSKRLTAVLSLVAVMIVLTYQLSTFPFDENKNFVLHRKAKRFSCLLSCYSSIETPSNTPLPLLHNNEDSLLYPAELKAAAATVKKLEQCMTLRPVPSLLQKENNTNSTTRRIGLVFVEDPDHFVSRKPFHMFHFVEFLVAAYTEIHVLYQNHRDAVIDVPWIYVPHMTSLEIEGGASQMNLLFAQMLFNNNHTADAGKIKGASFRDECSSCCMANSNNGSSHCTGMVGSEINDKATSAIHSIFRSTNSNINATNVRRNMLAVADQVMLIHRPKCDDGGINKMWFSYLDSFPADAWSKAISASSDEHRKQQHDDQPSKKKKPIVVSYIDRQNRRRRLPKSDHDWLVAFLANNTEIEFRHLRMEDYDAKEQIQLAMETDVMIGVHGNGLTHQFWMKPHSRVLEFFWRFQFQFDYGTAARLMRHNYMAIFNGDVLDTIRIIDGLDVAMVEDLNWNYKAKRGKANYLFTDATKQAIATFLNDAIKERQQS